MRGAKPTAALKTSIGREIALAPGETVVVACSGGPDSVALACLTAQAAHDARARVVLAHVNHGVRPRAAQDEALVLALGSSLSRGAGAVVQVAIRALEPGSADEARLRTERYAALVEIARSGGAARVLTGHHARDQTETVLLALFRGTGPAGLAGIAPVRELAAGIRLERPLLRVDPLALRAYCALSGHAYVLDASNGDRSLRRSAVRALLDEARPHFAGLDEAVARYAEIARDERDRRPRAKLRSAVRLELERVLGDTRDVGFERVEAVVRSLEAGRTGRHFIRRGVESVVP